MILMAADYVGFQITKYLCQRNESIQVFVYDVENRGDYNHKMIECIRQVSSNTAIYSNLEFDDPEVKAMIQNKDIEIGVLAWWPYIIDHSVISLTQRGFINTHPSYLPYNRGKHPYFWSIVEGTPFGVTIHYVNEGIDTGEIIAQKKIPVTWTDTGESLYLKSREETITLFSDVFEKFKKNLLSSFKQDSKCETMHWGKMLEPYCKIDLDKQYTARDLLNIIRGRTFSCGGGANFSENGKRYVISIKIDEVSDK